MGAQSGAIRSDPCAMMDILGYVSFAGSFFLLFAIRRWIATGETIWIFALLILCAPGWAHEIGWL